MHENLRPWRWWLGLVFMLAFGVLCVAAGAFSLSDAASRKTEMTEWAERRASIVEELRSAEGMSPEEFLDQATEAATLKELESWPYYRERYLNSYISGIASVATGALLVAGFAIFLTLDQTRHGDARRAYRRSTIRLVALIDIVAVVISFGAPPVISSLVFT